MKKHGFTFMETMVSISVLAIAGGGIYLVLRTGLLLFAKNAAVNFTHQQVRVALVQLQQDLHASVSIPQLVDANNTVVTGTGPAAGVAFRKYAAGPFALDVPSNPVISGSVTQISIVTGTKGTTADYCPRVGQRLHIQVLPTSMVELDVTAVATPSSTSAGTVYKLTLAGPPGTDIQVRNPADNAALSVACFLTSPVRYIVKNGQLVNFYLGSSGTVSRVVASSVTTTVPFFIPAVNGSTNTAFIATGNFAVKDNVSGNLQFHSGTFSLSLQTPHWSQVTANY